MRKDARVLFPIFLIIGCSQGHENLQASPGALTDPLSLSGPGGTVRIGDPFDRAKVAFPAPKGSWEEDSNVLNDSPKRTWSWRTNSEPRKCFEATAKNGRIVSMSLSEAGHGDSHAPARLGPPSHKLEEKRGTFSGWEVGDNARWAIEYQGLKADPGPAFLVFIGSKKELGPMPTKAEDLEVAFALVEGMASFLKTLGQEVGEKPKQTSPRKG